MVMGIVSALGLAIYSLNASTGITKQIVAVGLAREGLEVVKNMRDTNWLRDPVETNCFDYTKGQLIAHCYAQWLNPTLGYNLDLSPPADIKSYMLTFSGDQSVPWSLDSNASNEDATPPAASLFALDYDANNTDGLYKPAADPNQPTSEYFRKITIEYESSYFPYNDASGNYPLLIVTSQVWWKDRRCPVRAVAPNRNTADVRCLVTLQTYLTNWKIY